MKIVVKISDIEIIVDNPEFVEIQNFDYQQKQSDKIIIPILKEATKSALDLYNNRIKQLKETE